MEGGNTRQNGKLKKCITSFDAMFYVVGFVIGSGIFMKPAIVLQNSGSSAMALIAWIIGGVMALTAALTVGELASHIPKLGGMHAYLIDLYGDTFGFLYGWTESIISCPASSAGLAIAFATFATFFVPLGDWELKIVAITVIIAITAAQIASTRYGVWLQVAATVGKLLPMVAIVAFGLAKGTVGDISFLTDGITPGKGVGAALLGVVWAYDGWLSCCTLGSEMEDSQRGLPRALVGGVAFVMVVYILFNIGIFNVLPATAVVASKRIGIDVSLKLFGNIGTTIIALGMLVSVFGALNAQITVGTRYFFSMGSRNQIPGSKFLSTVTSKESTPINSLIAHAIVSILFILSGTFNSVTDLAIFTIWIFYTIGVGGIFVLRKRETEDNRGKLYHVPLYPIVPIIAVLGGSFMLISAVRSNFTHSMVGILLTVIGLPLYYYQKKKSAAKAIE